MHSRIFVVSKNLNDTIENINTNKDDLYENYCNNFADYVAKSEDFEDDIEWLKTNHSDKLNFDENTFTINKEGISEYLSDKLDLLVTKVNGLTYKKWIDDFDADVWSIKTLLNEYGGFKIFFDGSLYGFDEFLRNFLNEETPFKIVASFDYHY